ncbi:unnamed protein product [Cochlearia groenlandica]
MATQTNKDLFFIGLEKLLKDEHFVDVRLKACDTGNGAPISAHKLILSTRSEVLKKILECDDECKASSRKDAITFSELKHEELVSFVEFLYSDGSMLSEKAKQHVRVLYVAADKYMITNLRDLCRTQLNSSLTPLNALEVFLLAQIPFDKSLRDAALAKITANRTTIVASVEFKAFAVDHPNLTVEIVKAISMAKPICACGGGTIYCQCCRRYF